MTHYDAIAGEYLDSKELPFRRFVECYTLFRMLGDVRDRIVLDLACGFERTCETSAPGEGDAIPYTFAGSDGKPFRFRNFFLSPETYDDAFRTVGFRDFRWIPAALDPAVRHDPFWEAFMASPPIIAFEATRAVLSTTSIWIGSAEGLRRRGE